MELNKFVFISSAIFILCASKPLLAQPASVRFDPYAIKKHIAGKSPFDVTALWRELGISSELATVYKRVGIVPDSPAHFDTCRDCAAEIHPLKWRGMPGRVVALKICQPMGMCRFLLFRQRDGEQPGRATWLFIGHADHDFALYYPPKHRTEKLGDGYYFVMTAQGVSGTGVSLQYERWYEVAPEGIKEVLSLPAKGHECSSASSLCRSFAARVEKAKSDPRRVRVLFQVQYDGNRFLLDGKSFAEIPLFTKQRRTIYVRSEKTGDYIPSSGEAEIAAKEMQRTSIIGDYSCADFIRFNSHNLMRLASGPDGEARRWLRRYVPGCEPSVERERLLETLAR
ncbi:MAG TPA: hypothetical protein DCG53_12020 [Syntrophus sp. (in: bacteria)]|nr:hypothetical protein [Syntrophus sp. (in: bacteria)]